MTENHAYEVGRILKGISRKVAYKFLTKTAEEIESDLWVTVLEEELKHGKELDNSLIATICYRQIIDMQRHDMKRNASSFEEILETEEGEESSSSQSDEMHSGSRFDSDVMVKDLFKIFPAGSKERIFLEFWGESSGALRSNHIKSEKFTESELAKLLGYAGTASGGYKKFRDKMRTYVASYFMIERG